MKFQPSSRTAWMHRGIVAASIAASLPTTNAAAQEVSGGAAVRQQASSIHLVEVERAFWACDYLATTYGYVAVDAHLCSMWTDALRDRKFGGDFERLLAWWRENKRAQHERHGATELVRR